MNHDSNRCRIPECEGESNEVTFDPLWLENAIPLEHDGSFASCSRYTAVNSTPVTGDVCPPEKFNERRIKCDSYVYARENSVVYEFDLGCKNWMRALAGTLNSLGTLLVLPVIGYISDHFGRRIALVISVFNMALFGLIRAFSVNYPMYLALHLIQATLGAGAFSSAYIFATELVGPKYRVITSVMSSCMFAAGNALMGLVALYVQPWRHLIMVLHIPCFFITAYYWLLPESIRWLIAQQRFEEARQILLKVAATNKKEIDEKIIEELLKPPLNDNIGNENSSLVKSIFRSPILLRRVCTIPIWWISSIFIYYGLIMNSTTLTNNMHLTYILTALIEIPGYVVAVILLDRIGRKPTLSGGYFLCAVCNLTFIFLDEDLGSLRLIIYMMGKCAIAIVMTSNYLYTSELYPTKHRHTLLGFSSMVGRIGSICAPFTTVLGDYWPGLPSLLFGSIGLIAGCLVLTQPETRGNKVPDTLAEAEAIGVPQTEL